MKVNIFICIIIIFALSGCTFLQHNKITIPENLAPFGDGYLYKGDLCRRLGESKDTINYLDHTRTLVGCPKSAKESINYIIKVQKAKKVKEIDNIILFSVK